MAKRQFNYIKAMQALKGKVNFNYRNQSNETLSVGRKAAIRRAFNDLQELKSTQLIKPPKKKGEKKSTYEKRVRRLKKQYGQTGQSLFGVAVSVPDGGKATFKGDQLTITKPGTNYREEIISIENPAEFVEDVYGWIYDEITTRRPDAVVPFHTHWRGNTGRLFFYDDSAELEETIEEFAGEIESILNQYKGNPNVMTGFLFQYNLQ